MPAEPASGPTHSPENGNDRNKENASPDSLGKKLPTPPAAAPDTLLNDATAQLTEGAVKELVRRQRQAEKQGMLAGHDGLDGCAPLHRSSGPPAPHHARYATDPNSLAVNGAQAPLPVIYHSRNPTDVTQQRKSDSARDAAAGGGGGGGGRGDTESDGEQPFLQPRVQRFVETYLDSLKGLTFADDATPEVSDKPERVQLEERIRFMARDTLRQMVLDYNEELSCALDELLVLEERVMELDDENAHLEHQVSRKQETIDMLQVELSASADYVDSLIAEKKESIRNLTATKSELAILAARNAKLQKQLTAHAGDDVSRDSCELGRTLNMLSVEGLSNIRDNDSDDSVNHSGVRRGSREEALSPNGGRRIVEAATRSVAEAQAKLDTANKKIEQLEKEAAEREKKMADLQTIFDTRDAAAMAKASPTPEGATCDARALRRLSTHAQPSKSDASEDKETPARGGDAAGEGPRKAPGRMPGEAAATPAAEEETGARGRVNNVWRRMYEESVVRLGRLEREVERFKAAAATTASASSPPHVANAPSPTQPATATHADSAELDTARKECQKLRGALASEQERTKRLAAVESELLMQVADLAGKLRAKENAERALRTQRRAEGTLSRDELLANLSNPQAPPSQKENTEPLKKVSATNSRGDNEDASARRRSDVLKAFDQVKLRAERTRSSRNAANDTPPPSTDLRDSQEMSYSPSHAAPVLAWDMRGETKSPSPPRQRGRSGSLVVPSGHIRKSISAVLNSSRDPLMSSQKEHPDDLHLQSSISSLGSPAGPPATNTAFVRALRNSHDDTSLDASITAMQSSSQTQPQHQMPTQTVSPQPVPRRSGSGQGLALPAPVRIPIRMNGSAPASGTTTPRGARERSAHPHSQGHDLANTISAGTAVRRGITRGVSQDRAPRRRSSSQTVGVASGAAKQRASSMRAGAGGAIPAGRR